MNSCVFLCVFLIVGVVHADIVANVMASYKACAEENNISMEEVQVFRSTVDKSSIIVTDDLKVNHTKNGPTQIYLNCFFFSFFFQCLTKCVIEKNNLVSDGINTEHLVEVSIAMGRKEAAVRANIEKCKALKASNIDCDDAYKLFVCMLQQ